MNMIKRLYRQHTTVVVTIPRPVLDALDVQAGDYVGMDIDERDHEVTLFKIKGRSKDGRTNEDDQGQPDTGGKT